MKRVASQTRLVDSLDEQTAALRERLIRSGQAWITSTVLRGERVLRVTMMNPRTTEARIDGMIEGLRVLGDE